jgi:hypothetical protein
MRFTRSTAVLPLIAGLVALTMACSSAASVPSRAEPSSPTPAVAAAIPSPLANTSGRKEVSLVAGPRRRLEETLSALQRGDIPAARAAFEAYDGDWNGIEVYVNFRSRALYGQIENDYEVPISKALEAAQPNVAETIPQLREMIAKYNEAIKLSYTGPAISPLFDDVAAIRIVRAPLREAGPALKAGDLEKAKTAFAAFRDHWDDVEDLVKVRSADDYREIEQAMGRTDRAFSSAASAAELSLLVDTLTERYNYGLNLITAAARNADISKTSFTPQDVSAAAAIGGIQKELRTSLSQWEAGNYQAAGDSARGASGQRFDSVSATLQAKSGADAALKKALDAYAALSDQPGDTAKVRSANKAAIEAAAIAQQAAAGQFWTDPRFQTAYQQAISAT